LLLYYITDRMQFPGDETARRRLLLEKIGEAAACGVDFIQLREKDLPIRTLEALARDAVRAIRAEPSSRTRLLINSRADVAMASAAEGVHLRSDDISPRNAGLVSSHRADPGAGERTAPVIGVSCHTLAEVERAHVEGADFAVFGPVFEKKDEKNADDSRPAGLDLLRQACQHKIPVLALGGITLENAGACLNIGAAGVAGIRLFQENEIAEVVRRLRD
jgi:thiamine-phosphate pyrophosphorylase